MLPYKFKKNSFFLIPSGLLLIFLYLNGIKPELLDIPVFAFVSTYFENRYFSFIRTNAIDEIGIVLFFTGVYFLIFSEEKDEREDFNLLRLKAIFFSLKLTLLIWLLSYFFFYGYIIFPISSLMLIICISIYYAYFRFSIKNHN